LGFFRRKWYFRIISKQ